MFRTRNVVQALLLCGLASGAGAQSAYKVLDIYPGPQGSYPNDFTRSGNVTFFTAVDPAHGRELWRSDGTAAGTVLVKDITVGPTSTSLANLTDVNGTLFFRIAGFGLGHQLWKSDGTAAGTVQVAQLAPSGSNVTGFVAAGGILFFSSNAGGVGQELWKSDGTAAGTVLVKDIAPGSASASPTGATAFGTGVIFAATVAGQGVELWKSDGTAAGTVQVADIAPGSASSSPSATKVVSGGRVYFAATRTGNGRELWTSDGTAAGTLLVADIAPGATSSSPDQLAVSNGVVYFRAFEPSTGTELYRTDGTAAGTVRIADISPGTPSSYPAEFLSLGAHTIFTAGDDATVGTPEVYRTDGTEAGTFILKDINPGPQSSLPGLLATLGARTYFSANDTVAGYELWRTDGTEEGTRLVRDIQLGPQSAFPGPAIAAGGMLLFRAEDTPLDAELWAVNGGAPEADAGPDQTVEDGESVTLDGSASTDPQDDPITFEWRDAAGTVLGTTITFTGTFPRGIHEVTLVVSDGVNTGTDTVSVRVGRILDVVLTGDEGTGGTVTAVPGGTCHQVGGGSTSCAFAYEDGAAVALTATPATGATFAGWEGACTGTEPCSVAMTESQVVTARFVRQQMLSVDVTGEENGLGSVRIDPPGDLCTLTTPGGGLICERWYTQGDTVVLTALPAPGSVFVGWTHPACSGTGTCTISMDMQQVVSARFLGPRTLFVQVTGEENGLGSVRIDPPGDLCPLTTPGGGQICERSYTQGDTVVLTALPAPGSVFVGWTHPVCSGTGTCTIAMDFNQVVSARFLGPRTLFVQVTGEENGLGSVRIDPPGDLCPLTTPGGGQICERSYTQGDTVVLTALPAPGSVFVGWTHPACSGTGTCTIAMDFNQVVSARFLGPRTLYVQVTGEENGLGSVRIDPPGDLCTLTTPGGGQICERSYTQGDTVVLTALPAPGSVFVGWTHPACSGTGTCTIAMDFNQVVSARFLGPRTLFVQVTGEENGLGSVRIDPPGELCTLTTPGGGEICERSYTQGDTVVLTALPAPGSVFVGWTHPACSGTGTCTIAMDFHQVVSARFLGPRTLFVDVRGDENGLGAVRIDPPGELCTLTTPGGSQICERSYTQGDTVVLTALPVPGSAFVGWNHPACPGTGTCTLTMDVHQALSARFLGPRTLLVDVTSLENGLGSVRIDPPGELCTLTTPGGDQICERSYTQGDTVVLTALPAPGSAFIGWNHPACPGTGTCTLTMDVHQSLSARFLGPRTLLVDVTSLENGLGSVRIDPPGELCTLTTPGGDQICERSYTQGDTVVLTALPVPGSAFIGWNHPACPGTGTCTLTMDVHQSVAARFLGPRAVEVVVFAQGDAAGAVRIDPPGTLCPVTTSAPNHCVETAAPGTEVQLTALPGPGTTFEAWGAPCQGTGPCTLTPTEALTVVQAIFRRVNQPPAVAVTAPAAGAVIPPATSVTLTASAADADGSVTRVEFFVDGFEVGESTTAPWAAVWTPAGPGPYTLTARATDDDGAPADSAPVPVVVNAPPTIAIVAPLPGTPFVAPATVTLAADATDPDGTIARVEFFEGGVSRGSDTTSPYSVVWSNVAAGSHALTAVATDDRGASTSVSFAVVVSAQVAPSADAHVRDGGHAGTNYGGSSTLEVRRSGSSGQTRRTYLRFPIAALSTVSGARLRLYGRLNDTTGSPVQAQVLAVASTTWSETGITWNNKPATQPVPLATTALDHTTTAERWYEWDVTAYVQAEKAAGRTAVSFAVVEAANAPLATFRARTASAGVRPELVLVP